MRLLIDIPDEDYNWIRNAKEGYTSYPISLRLYLAVAAGTPLPKNVFEILKEYADKIDETINGIVEQKRQEVIADRWKKGDK